METRHYQVRSPLEFKDFVHSLLNASLGSDGLPGHPQVRKVDSRTPRYDERDCTVDVAFNDYTQGGSVRRVQIEADVRISGKPTDRVYELVAKPETVRALFDRKHIDRAIEYIDLESLPQHESGRRNPNLQQLANDAVFSDGS